MLTIIFGAFIPMNIQIDLNNYRNNVIYQIDLLFPKEQKILQIIIIYMCHTCAKEFLKFKL